MQKALAKARRALKKAETDRTKPLEEYEDAISEFEAQQAWRGPAAAALKSEIESYLAAIRETLGARMQQRLSRDQALFVAACSSSHRDISLNF